MTTLTIDFCLFYVVLNQSVFTQSMIKCIHNIATRSIVFKDPIHSSSDVYYGILSLHRLKVIFFAAY